MPAVDLNLFKLDQFLTGSFVSVTPSDTVPVTVNGHYPRAMYVGSGGNISLVNDAGNAVLWENVPTGTFIKGVCYTYVMATSTTASSIIAIG